MLVLDMLYLDWIVKKEKTTDTFEMSFSCFGPFEVWGMTISNMILKPPFCGHGNHMHC